MLKGKELYKRLQEDICNIILNSTNNVIFLTGDNSTGKSEIGKLLKDKVLVLDNYKGTYEDIPKDKKVLVITYNLRLLLATGENANVIVTKYNNLYVTTTTQTFNSYDDIVTFVESDNVLSAILNNAISHNWSELNEMYLNEYILNNKITATEKLVIDMINKCKNK